LAGNWQHEVPQKEMRSDLRIYVIEINFEVVHIATVWSSVFASSKP
jgi:hypothetical protein